MGIEFLANLLSALPGTVVYHLLVFLGLISAVGIILTEWRHTKNAELIPYFIGVGGTIGIHLLSVFIAPLCLQSNNILATFSAPFLYAGDFLSLLLLLWAFGHHIFAENSRKILMGFLGSWSVLFLLAFFLWWREVTTKPVTYTIHSWQVSAWYILSALTAFIAAGLLIRTRKEEDVIAPSAFVLLGIGSILGAWGSPIWTQPLLIGEGIGRLFYLIGYPLFAISLYNTALTDLQSYRQELQLLSQESLRQSQELLFLVEATRSIGETIDLSGMLGRVADSVAMALQADTVAILLTDEKNPGAMQLSALYQILGTPTRLPRPVSLKTYPMFAVALKRKLVFGQNEDFEPLRPIFKLLGVSGEGPLLIYPLTRQERTMGLLIACNDNSKAAFTQEQERLLSTMTVQIAGAVENSRLYQTLEAKALELSQLLNEREAELRREEAILESMAEGILVLDAKGEVILLNEATENILALQREEVLRHTARELLEYPALKGEIDLESMLNIKEPMQATLDLADNKVRIHASPVVLNTGKRLGVVAILQDITREHLAEESKREFIASISHELRTPLTAIKGYTEVMMAGMVGQLPAGVLQFMSVIRENTVRMTSLTDNIISVAEIERGRLGLNYEMINIEKLVHEMISLYEDRIAERQLALKLDFPEQLPDIEVDAHRLRLVLDNLLSNAIHFTYPSGRLTVGCRAIQGTLGEPTFFSLWVSDTGVGIPVADQPRIWERFYRVDNPLSLEAGGLGIGLTITKALVEAHGGRVWVDSTLDKGSTFTVLLPTSKSMAIPRGLEVEVVS
ncbi:MAG: PAS domain-containing protein [Anaerolineae bacterium]|nr:PAS domain-containing protein [Anaerolineae bacterium]